jgi:hypothetical protein
MRSSLRRSKSDQEHSDALLPFSVIASLLGVTKTRISWEWKPWGFQKSRRCIAHEYADPEFLLSENCSAHFGGDLSVISHENSLLLLDIPHVIQLVNGFRSAAAMQML